MQVQNCDTKYTLNLHSIIKPEAVFYYWNFIRVYLRKTESDYIPSSKEQLKQVLNTRKKLAAVDLLGAVGIARSIILPRIYWSKYTSCCSPNGNYTDSSN